MDNTCAAKSMPAMERESAATTVTMAYALRCCHDSGDDLESKFWGGWFVVNPGRNLYSSSSMFADGSAEYLSSSSFHRGKTSNSCPYDAASL